MATKEEVLERAKKDGIQFIQLEFVDLNGMMKTVTIPVARLKETLEKGNWFDGSSIEGFTRICESDMYLMLDTDTYAVLPWESHKTARIICDVYTPDGKPFEGDPRYILKKVLKEAEELGYVYNVGPELEFFIFKRDADGKPIPVTHDKAGYFDYAPRDLADDVRKDVTLILTSLGMEVEMSHHEVAPGQHEINFSYGDALTQADRCMTFKHAVKSIANKNGLYATFMPKPVFGENGSGMHVHQSFWDIKAKKNAFYDPSEPYKLSAIAKSFVAGQLAHVKAFCAITAPTVNSYKRLVPGYEAPVYICWAKINRSALIRVPRYSPGRESSTRVELRCPDPSANPYLAFAVMLKAGLDGIKKKMAPPTPVEEDVYEFDASKRREVGIDTLPGSLGEALDNLDKDAIIKDVLGAHAYSAYVKTKRMEWDKYRIQVTQWEIDTYFESI
ncbi:MAG: type I glutamate--ammonia ligase [Nanoarchaeota archaeon]|nr:type I glutamate--ammonia ligase [Nanoarchaeota archaeon]